MNEITRRAANALVATVDFFSGALAAETQAGEEKQKYLEALADQLKHRDTDIAGRGPILTIEEARKILAVLQHVRRLLTVFPRKSKGPLATFSGIVDDLERAMKDLDGIKLEL